MPTFEREIADSPERVYERIVDLRSYGEWLPRSAAYRGTEEIAPGPVRVGTTFVERDLSGVRRGEVVELEAPRRVVFTQRLTPRPALLGGLDIRQTYELFPESGRVRVRRTAEFTPRGAMAAIFWLMRPLYVRENERIMDALVHSATG